MTIAFDDIEVLTLEECERASAEVLQLRSYWIPRNPPLPFFTLGAASYIDAAKGSAQYKILAESNNPILSSTFLWLQTRLCESMQKALGEPFDFSPGLALPGFHIFLAHQAFAEEDAASAHWDLQFRQIEWLPEDEPDFTAPLSFTLPVSLPQSGAGLNLWEVSHKEAGTLTALDREKRRLQSASQYHPYEIGHMVLHSGLYLHQIAPMKGAQPGENRITYQGHALRCAGRWRLYW